MSLDEDPSIAGQIKTSIKDFSRIHGNDTPADTPNELPSSPTRQPPRVVTTLQDTEEGNAMKGRKSTI